jgi:DNA-binding FadR family transcriptional regulator
VTRLLALQVVRAERRGEQVSFPNETDLCHELGVSRTVLRESMKVLADKAMVEMRPRTGTRARPRSEWRLLDPDILGWQAEVSPDVRFLRDLSEVRLAIEPTAAGFAAIRATPAEVEGIERCLGRREALVASTHEPIVDTELEFHAAVVAASHNPLLVQLSATIREPLRIGLLATRPSAVNVALALKAQRDVLQALHRRNPVSAKQAAEKAVGLAMIAIEEQIEAEASGKPRKRR